MQFVGPAQHFPPGGPGELHPQQVRLVLVEPVGELASLLLGQANTVRSSGSKLMPES